MLKYNNISLNASDSTGACDSTIAYTNLDPTPLNVGGIAIGETFDDQSLQQMFDRLLYPELFPSLTNPSRSFSLSPSGLREINETISTLNFNASFNRGSISPTYGTDGYRSGLPNAYNYTGTGLPSSVASISLSNSQQLTNYTVLTGVQS